MRVMGAGWQRPGAFDPKAQTPAVKYNDGRDFLYLPTAGLFSAISFLPLPVQAL